MKKALKILAALIGLIVVALVVLVFALRNPLPEGTPGPAGDELAHKVAASIGADAWDRLNIIKWTFAGSHHYLWDKANGFVRLRMGEDEALYDLMKNGGRAFHKGEEQTGEAQTKILARAYAMFCNDSFWLNPLVKLFDQGTSRAAVTVDGKPALLISYASGGVTPGDKYVWLLDEQSRPIAWHVYASVTKIAPGVEFTWGDWTTLPGGAQVSTAHRVLWKALHMQSVTELQAGARIDELEPGPDPFAGLAAKR